MMNWKVTAGLLVALLVLFAMIFFIPMEHDMALILGLISMVIFLLAAASIATATYHWLRNKLRTARH